MDVSGKPLANKNSSARPSKGHRQTDRGGLIPGVSPLPCGPALAEPTSKNSKNSAENPGVVTGLRGPGRPPGYAKTGGRLKGSKNKRKKEIEEALRPLVPKAKRKLKALIDSEDDKIAYSACMGVLSYVFGKPIDRKQIGGDPDNPLSINDNREPLDMTELARRAAFLLDFAARDGDETRRPAEAPRDGATAQAAGVAVSPSAAAPAPDPAPEDTHEAAPEAPAGYAYYEPVSGQPSPRRSERPEVHGGYPHRKRI